MEDDLEGIFGEMPISEDSIMSEASKIFKYQDAIGNPYAFHTAYEFAKRELESFEEARKLLNDKAK